MTSRSPECEREGDVRHAARVEAAEHRVLRGALDVPHHHARGVRGGVSATVLDDAAKGEWPTSEAAARAAALAAETAADPECASPKAAMRPSLGCVYTTSSARRQRATSACEPPRRPPLPFPPLRGAHPLHTATYAQDECRRAQRARFAHTRVQELTDTHVLPAVRILYTASCRDCSALPEWLSPRGKAGRWRAIRTPAGRSCTPAPARAAPRKAFPCHAGPRS